MIIHCISVFVVTFEQINTQVSTFLFKVNNRNTRLEKGVKYVES